MASNEWPKGWGLHRLGDLLADIQPGFACGEKSASEGIPHLRMNNIGVNGKIDLSLIWRVPDALERTSKYCLHKGDVLFNNTNSPALVGKTALFNEEGVYVYSNHLTRLRVKPLLLMPEWLALWLQHLWRRRYFESLCHRWINQAAVGREKLQEVEISLPPLVEQRRIVARIEELMQRIEELRRLHEEAGREIAAMSGAVLAKTFRGELLL
jgi:type I restriction enzyme S subunit